jgi:hypothetical protein
MKWRASLLAGIGVLLVLCLILTLALNRHRFASPAAGYSLDLTYTHLPRDDRAITRWIKEQAGWRDVKVSRYGNKVALQFAVDRAPRPTALHEIMNECKRLGYEGRTIYRGTLTDRAQPGTSWHTFWVEFKELPGDDGAVSAWLAARPKVSQTTVSRDGKTVAFEFLLASPPPPDLLGEIVKKCEEVGYEGRQGYIHAFGRYH